MRTWTATTALVLAMLVPWQAGAVEGADGVTDIADDAHGLMVSYWDGGLVGVTYSMYANTCDGVRSVLANDGDCLGNGVAIPQLSRPEADILGLTLETAYEAVPVGEDGIDYRATGLRISIRTAAIPRSSGRTVEFVLFTELAGDCVTRFSARIGDGEPVGEAYLAGGSYPAGCGDVQRQTAIPSEHLEVTTSPPGVVMTVPFSLFGPGIDQYLDDWAPVMRPWLYSQVIAELGSDPTNTGQYLDKAPRMDTFFMASDMPEDVPCTRGCP